MGQKMVPPGGAGGGGGGSHVSQRLIKGKHEKISSATTRPRALIFDV